eukprot:SAG11_NODE_3408_length_2465_cov_3.113694_3_plen_136_part_00
MLFVADKHFAVTCRRQGNTDNPIAVDPTGDLLYHCVRDEAEPDPAKRYKGLFAVANRKAAVSPDGFAWAMLDVAPVPSRDESQLSYDPAAARWLACVKQPTEWGRSVFLSTCPATDFGAFTPPQVGAQACPVQQV